MIDWNYHTHTKLCHHASGLPKDYIRAAHEAGLKELGMSDHVPHPDGRWSHTRMEMHQKQDYQEMILAEKEHYPDMIIRTGYECEWYPGVRDYYEEELVDNPEVEFLIFGEHWTPHKGTWLNLTDLETPSHLISYAENQMEAMETGFFLFTAHPDMFGLGWKTWDDNAADCARDICRTAVVTDTPLEINSYGFRKPEVEHDGVIGRPYPWRPFWEIAAEEGVIVTTNSDAHRPEDIVADTDGTTALAADLGLTTIINPWEYKHGK